MNDVIMWQSLFQNGTTIPLKKDWENGWSEGLKVQLSNFCPLALVALPVKNSFSFFADFLSKIAEPMVGSSVEALEELLEKSVKLLHPHHYVVNLIRYSGDHITMLLTC